MLHKTEAGAAHRDAGDFPFAAFQIAVAPAQDLHAAGGGNRIGQGDRLVSSIISAQTLGDIGESDPAAKLQSIGAAIAANSKCFCCSVVAPTCPALASASWCFVARAVAPLLPPLKLTLRVLLSPVTA